jgi:hypothetical protein
VALVIGVIVAGLGIGALISAYQNRGGPPQLGAGIPPVTPVPAATPQPDQSPLAAPSSTPTPTPEPTDSPTPSATDTPAPSPTPLATASPVPSPSPTATATPTATPTAAPTATATPTPVATPLPTPRPTLAPATAAPARAPSDAAATVRRYLEAVIGGDTASAGAMLASGGTVKEAAVLDASAHITSVHVTRSDASGAFVEADITTSRGSFVATFHVTTAANGGTIDQHDYIKV